MCSEDNHMEEILRDIRDIKQNIHDIKNNIVLLKDSMKEMKQESRLTGLATLLALAITFIGVGFFFMQYSPSTYMQYYFIVIGVVLGVWTIVRYFPKSRTSDENKSKDG